ncbi:phosphoenolpyruvate--protein phosphotransferase [Caproiciproducens galactitolivorans]|uniref:Phosphoenolpyruvate-protein phosphotransferase n=1 Tax=Caproiciproducens galactitolivorans TaxID=642589 RepID=A0A4Z0Y952_9FIRM|nr:phosphoenolpyruvate--protein phosphotransferase [Caproiciproducens galactitolivorans]TGJ75801.1 phosphoenolpyruvate-protein phosphotransferase [Caproiciproducens galactitolivorans]
MVYQGNPVSEGIAVGKIMLYEPFVPVVDTTALPKEEIPAALSRYKNARNSAKKELEALYSRLQQDDPGKAKIIKAHMDILFDVAMEEEIQDAISDGKSVEAAVDKIFRKYIRIIGKSADERIRERASDLEDVRCRLLRNCMGVKEKNLAVLTDPVVVVAKDLFPSDTASMNRNKVLAIVTEVGGPTSHTAIIARSYEIPALLGVPDILFQLQNGQEVIVDAVDGALITDPTDEEKEAYRGKKVQFQEQTAETKKYLASDGVTKDGVKIEVELNIGSANAQEVHDIQYTDGVGLFRSEFLYMGRDTLPSEEEQYKIYRKVLMQAGNNPVTLRTLDIGGDKKLDCLELPKEDNPFLGNRALRLCLQHRDIFKTQLRAALRAGTIGNLWIMFPMVGSMDDIRNAKAVVREVQQDLDRENIKYGKNVKFGIMIEIPSIAMIADLAVKEVDFASIGTNDLCQYTTAVDRLNQNVAKYYQSYHPAMFRLIRYTVEQFNKAGKPICVCGELGGDKLAMPVLLGFGMRRISMGIASVARAKKIISRLDLRFAKEMADKVCQMETAGEIEAYLKDSLKDVI